MRNTIVCLLLGGSLMGYSQQEARFPRMEAETLTNELMILPEDVMGKYSLIGVAFSKKSEEDLKSWFKPMYNQFIYKNPNPSVFDFSFDINCYFIPMFTGAKKAAYQKVMDKAKKELDKRLQPYVLFYKGTLQEYEEPLNFSGNEVPYFYVLDPSGAIVYQTSGKYTREKMQNITDAVESAMNIGK